MLQCQIVACFWCIADEIQKFMEEVKTLGYQDKPPYAKLRSILHAGLKAIQAKDDGKLEFTAAPGAVSVAAKVKHLQRQDHI